jgi:DDE superfamily endonuclease/Winged helix-turn helix
MWRIAGYSTPHNAAMVCAHRLVNRAKAVAAHDLCGDVHIAARLVCKSPAYVRRWLQRYKTTGTLSDAPRSGRPLRLSATACAAARTLVLKLQSVPHAAAHMSAAGTIPAGTHVTTVRRAIRRGRNGLNWRPETPVPLITKQAMARRLKFARHHLQKETSWACVLALDSTMVRITRPGGRKMVWAAKCSAAQRATTQKQVAVHVYGGISAFGKTRLVFASGTTGLPARKDSNGEKITTVRSAEYQEIMGQSLLPDADELFAVAGVDSYQVLQDNAPPHTSHSSKRWLRANDVKLIEHWPASSPDLNPIENVWAYLKRRLYRRSISTVEQLKAALLEEWDALPEEMLTNAMLSMPRRLQAVLDRNGGYTGY